MEQQPGVFIDGGYRAGSSGEIDEILNPADESVVAAVTRGSRADAASALEAAAAAQPDWARLPAQSRAEVLHRLADGIENETEKLARLLTTEQGKTIREARGEVGASVAFLRFAAESARRIQGEIFTSEIPGEQIWIQRVPYGVTVGVLAWNFPLALACRKLGNALVTGNAMVLKPAELTPLAVLEMGRLANEAGVPAGVIGVVTGLGGEVGDELVRNPITRLVSLTGSTRAGQAIYRAAADNITVVRLELGGKAPFVILPDADLDAAVEAAAGSRYMNCGQVCTCNERMYIHEDIHDAFVDRFLERSAAVRVGDPLLETTDMGPKLSRDELEKVDALVRSSIQSGATLLTGGAPLTDGVYSRGYWYQPTVLTDVTGDMDVITKEVFGPVVPIVRISSFDDALEKANDSDYGLSAYLFTRDMPTIMRAVNELEFGEVYVNRGAGELLNGFHNGFKMSGVGGEDGIHGLEGYLAKKTVYVNHGGRDA